MFGTKNEDNWNYDGNKVVFPNTTVEMNVIMNDD